MVSFIFWKGKDFNNSSVTRMLPECSGGANLTLSSALCTKNRQPAALVTVIMPPKRRVGGRMCLDMNAHRGQMRQNLPDAFCERQEEKKQSFAFFF